MSQYYYLISSLPDLVRDGDFTSHPYPVFDEFVKEELSSEDYSDMKLCFLFNDIKNLANALDTENPESDRQYSTPSFLGTEEFDQGLEDPDMLFPFLGDTIYDFRAERRQFPERSLHWELLYRTLLSLASSEAGQVQGFGGFPLEYLLFEARLRNLATALGYRRSGRPYTGEIIPFDDFSNSIASSGSADFGLAKDLGFLEGLPEIFANDGPLEAEKKVSAARWHWLDDAVDYRLFSREAVFAYALKIADIQRWLVLTPEEGLRSLNLLLENLQRNIRSITQQEYHE